MSGAIGGVGRGEAQVYNMDRSMNQFDQLLQSQALERQREQKAIAEQLKSVDTKNLRDPDKDEYFKKYQDWQNSTAQLRTERNRDKKYQLQSQAEMKFQELKNFAARSAEAKQRDTEFGNRLLDDRFRDQFKDDAISQFQGNFKKSISDPTYLSDFNSLNRQVDEEKVMKKFTEGHKLLLSKAQWANPTQEKAMEGNNAGVYVQSKRSVSPQEQEAFYTNLYRGDRDVRKYISDRYPNMAPEDAIRQFAAEQWETGVLTESTKKEFRKNDNWKEQADYRFQQRLKADAISDARKGKATGDEAVTQRQTMVEGVYKFDPETMSRLNGIVMANPDYANTEGVTYARNKSNPNLVTFNVPTTWRTSLSSDGKSEIKTKQPGYSVKVDLSARNNAKSKINEMLNNITDSKVSNEAYFGQKGNRNKETAPVVNRSAKNGNSPAKSKTVSSQAVKSLVGKKGYEGYSEKELMDYYKSQGYSIK